MSPVLSSYSLSKFDTRSCFKSILKSTLQPVLNPGRSAGSKSETIRFGGRSFISFSGIDVDLNPFLDQLWFFLFVDGF